MASVKIYAAFNEDGHPRGFFADDIYPDLIEYGEAPEPTEEDPEPVAPEISRTRNPAIPAGAVLITCEQWQEFLSNQGHRRWNGQGVEEYTPPPPDPADVITVVSSVDFYRRMTEAEADQVEDVIAQQSARDRRIFEKANTFRSDAPEWPTLVGLATQLFGAERAAEILAPSQV
jgi:hypothetical protein